MREMADRDLRRITLFAEVSDRCCAALLDGARVQSCADRTMLFEEGKKPKFLDILVEGEVELFAEFNERETIISVLRSTSTLSLAATIDDVRHVTSGRTRGNSRLLTLSADAVRGALNYDGIFARAVARELARELCEMTMNLKNQKLLTCMERLAAWLLRADAQSGGSGQFMLPFGKNLLASHLGMTPENLSRSLKFLSGHGARITGRSVNLADPAALAAIAGIELLPRSARERPLNTASLVSSNL